MARHSDGSGRGGWWNAPVTDSHWMSSAHCRDYDPELFFPIGHSGPATAQAREAIEVCFACPVRSQCLDYALSQPVQGVWGGTTDIQRSKKRALARLEPWYASV